MIALVVVAVALLVLYRSITQGLPRFFLVPGHDWKDKIAAVVNHPKPIYLKIGTKRSAYRRRLVAASVQPSFYTNFVNNKLKINRTEPQDFIERMAHRDVDDDRRPVLYGFFHPTANNGGGGERVLWQAVKATLDHNPTNIAVVYTTATDVEPLAILGKARAKFHIAVDDARVVFIYLRQYGRLIDGDYWPHATLAGQLVGAAVLALEAMYELSPDVWIDTVGLPGSYWPVSRILKIPVLAYVHYPVIQEDMFTKLKYPNFKAVKAKNLSVGDVLHVGKLGYWLGLYFVYGYLGLMVDVALANGSWTRNHIESIWWRPAPTVVYPPCGDFELWTNTERDNSVLYIAQFRPEKRHALVLTEYAKYIESATVSDVPRLVFLGSCRTDDETQVLDALRHQVEQLELTSHVQFVVDCLYEEVLEHLSRAKYGLNAMWNEHFGIGVVEYLSRGVVPVVHASAGPLLDIVKHEKVALGGENDVGYFFKSTTDPDYVPNGEVGDLLEFSINGQTGRYPTLASLLEKLSHVTEPELESKRAAAIELLPKFSNQAFEAAWAASVSTLGHLEREFRETKRGDVERVY